MKDFMRRASSLEKPCEICGSVGFADLMVACFQCRETQEHIYCARVPLPSVPAIWLCEVCRSSIGQTETMIVKEEHATMALRTNAPKKGSDYASRPANFSRPSGKSTHKTSNLRIGSAEGIAEKSSSTKETKVSTPINVIPANCSSLQTSARDSCAGISADGSSVPHQLSHGDVSQMQTIPEDKETCLVFKEHRPFEAFPTPKRKRRTLRIMDAAKMDVKTAV